MTRFLPAPPRIIPNCCAVCPPEKRSGVRTARLLYDGINVRPLPSTRSTVLFAAKKDDTFAYLGEYPNWVCIRTADRKTAFVFKKYVSLQ